MGSGRGAYTLLRILPLRTLPFEFKTNAQQSNDEGSAHDAFEQIKENNYHAKYLKGKRPIHLVGVSFEKKTRNIGTWEEEVIATAG